MPDAVTNIPGPTACSVPLRRPRGTLARLLLLRRSGTTTDLNNAVPLGKEGST
jgi:hypothetical protein